jgi:ATP sulfurylase
MISRAAREVGASILLHPAVGVQYHGDLDQYTLIRKRSIEPIFQ